MADARPQAAPVPTMTFGKHNGKQVTEVPISYVMWLLVDKSTDNPLKRGNHDWIKASRQMTRQCSRRSWARSVGTERMGIPTFEVGIHAPPPSTVGGEASQNVLGRP